MKIYHLIRIPLVLWTLFTILMLVLPGSPDVVAGSEADLSNAGWTDIGAGSASGRGITDTDNHSHYPALAAVNEVAVLAWTEIVDGSDNEIYVKSWNGAQWAELGKGSASGGGISNNSGDSWQTAVTVDGNGRPVVAWFDRSDGGYQIYVKRWNGKTWVEMGNSASGGGISYTDGRSQTPSLANTDLGIVVAWGDDEDLYETGYQIYVRRWDAENGEWEEMGYGSASEGVGISNTAEDSYLPSVAVDRDGYPIIAWTQDYCGQDYENCPSEIYLRRWDDYYQEWVEMGDSASGGGISNNHGVSIRPTLAVDLNGTPLVAWQDDSSGNNQIYVKRWDAYHHAWVEMGDSASGGGISNTSVESRYPSMAIDPNGSPVVAWQDGPACTDDCDDEIFVRRWNQETYEWEEMDSGSASGSGISDDKAGYSVRPKLTFTSSGEAMVAWRHTNDHGADFDQIYGRRYTSCYELVLNHTGQGSDPIPMPANSLGCPLGSYKPGDQITLTAVPAPGSRVASWAGTDNDASAAESNSLTMPEGDHTVTVAYAAIYDFVPFICFDCSRGPTELEPNNIAQQANGPLCEGAVTVQGWPNDNWDYFKFNTTKTRDVSIVVTDHYGGGAQIALYRDWATVGSRIDYDSDATDGLEIDYEQAQPGLYYISIYTETPNPSETRPYTLHLVNR